MKNDKRKKKNLANATESEHQSGLPQKAAEKHLRNAISSYLPSAPKPVERPKIDPDLESMPAIERVTEVLKYNAQVFEYSISPKGGLRHWIKINISVLLLIGIPILLFVPIATYSMSQFANITEYLLVSLRNILYSIITFVVIVSVLYLIYRFAIFWIKRRSSGSDPSQEESGDYIDVTQGKE